MVIFNKQFILNFIDINLISHTKFEELKPDFQRVLFWMVSPKLLNMLIDYIFKVSSIHKAEDPLMSPKHYPNLLLCYNLSSEVVYSKLA